MKFQVDTEAFASLVGLVSPVAKSRTPNEQLRCVRVQAKKKEALRLTAHNGEMQISASLDAVDTTEDGDILVSGQHIDTVSRLHNSPTLSLTTKENILSVVGSGIHRLQTLGADEFPELRLDEEKASFVAPGRAIANAIRRVRWAIGDAGRYSIAGVLFVADGKTLEVVSTNGNVLSVARVRLQSPLSSRNKISFILPPVSAERVLATLDEQEQDCKVRAFDSAVSFECGGIELRSLLIEASPVPYGDVIKIDHNASKVVVHKQKLIDAAKFVMIDSGAEEEVAAIPRVELWFEKKGELIVRNHGMQADAIQCESEVVDGKMAIKQRYMLDALASLPGEVAELRYTAMNKPLFITSDDGVIVIMGLSFT